MRKPENEIKQRKVSNVDLSDTVRWQLWLTDTLFFKSSIIQILIHNHSKNMRMILKCFLFLGPLNFTLIPVWHFYFLNAWSFGGRSLSFLKHVSQDKSYWFSHIVIRALQEKPWLSWTVQKSGFVALSIIHRVRHGVSNKRNSLPYSRRFLLSCTDSPLYHHQRNPQTITFPPACSTDGITPHLFVSYMLFWYEHHVITYFVYFSPLGTVHLLILAFPFLFTTLSRASILDLPRYLVALRLLFCGYHLMKLPLENPWGSCFSHWWTCPLAQVCLSIYLFICVCESVCVFP